uniref:CSON004348 protein n=1 Tax=Culicoides sonorensis TaxID=179676 RepID=A0A336KB27_CULSO
MENSNSALASLTATYTDSEGEQDGKYDESEEENDKQETTDTSTKPSPVSSTSTQSPTQMKKALRLVSYNEMDDDEMQSPTRDQSFHEEDEKPVDETQDPEPQSEFNEVTSTSNIDHVKLYGFSLPPEPKSKCPQELQEKITKSYEKMKTNNLDMNKIIQERKEFRNPSIYEKLIQFCDINELGTNYPPEIYDPSHFGKESYYEELARVQKIEMDKLEKQKKEQVTIVVTGGSKKPTEVEKRKSKWDQPAPASVQIKPVASQTGTKTIVLNAFGSLSKKPKL